MQHESGQLNCIIMQAAFKDLVLFKHFLDGIVHVSLSRLPGEKTKAGKTFVEIKPQTGD